MGDDAINLRDQVAVVRRRWKIVVLCAVLGLVAALALSFTQTRMYQSAAKVELAPTDVSETSANGVLLQPAEIATQMQIVQSAPVAEKVIASVDSLPSDTTPEALLKTITVETEADTRVIYIRALRPSATQAQEVAQSFATEYLTLREDQAATRNKETLTALDDQIKEINGRLEVIAQRLITATDSKANTLRAEASALNLELTQVLGQRGAIVTSSSAVSGTGGQILNNAPLPTNPAEPKPMKSAVLGLFLGLILGIGLAFLRDHFDDAIRDESRLRETISPRPVLGRIPHWVNAKSGRLATVLDPASQVSESYRALSTSIRFMLAVAGENPTSIEVADTPARQLAKASIAPPPDAKGKVLLVTSPQEAEGKTSLASNLAVVAARFGLKVILVDADLRNPQISNVFGLGRPPGLSDLLANHDTHDDYIIEVEDLKVLPGGSLAPNPAELLASTRMQELLANLAAEADLVILDTTPVTRVSDGLELVPDSDLVILVARHARTRARALQETVDKIRQVGGDVSGAVYVDVPTRTGMDPYGYGHSYTGESSNEIAAHRDPVVPRSKAGAPDRQPKSGNDDAPSTLAKSSETTSSETKTETDVRSPEKKSEPSTSTNVKPVPGSKPSTDTGDDKPRISKAWR